MKVLTFGTFDHLHLGHIAYLQQGQAMGELWVIIARDENVKHIKGRLPDQSEDRRVKAVQGALPTAHVLLGDKTDYLKPVREVDPDIILMGYDQRLPPHIHEEDLPCKVVKAEPFEPEVHKSSFLRDREQ